ncbi:unnamed protein product [Urochloa decumbens]|uniref:Uncharacterized protein n=1 Tax=Urochloa decumbens TaxID=240449 RepID=A0ABC9E306_9POAL
MAASRAISMAGFLFLTVNSMVAIYRSQGDVAAVSVVVASYVCLLMLFCCLWWFEAALPGSPARDRARIGVWLTTTALTAMFSWRVAALMPGLVAAAVWFMAVSTVIGGFYALFLLPTQGDEIN